MGAVAWWLNGRPIGCLSVQQSKGVDQRRRAGEGQNYHELSWPTEEGRNLQYTRAPAEGMKDARKQACKRKDMDMEG
jgi:hypothetical protein